MFSIQWYRELLKYTYITLLSGLGMIVAIVATFIIAIE